MRISLLRNFGVFIAALPLACSIFVGNARGQTPAPMLGEVAGDDISVLGPSSVVSGASSHAIVFGGGGTVVVHWGRARVEFEGGGELEVCGPAKFTVLASGEALTIALSFGRVHAKFDASRPITIYTPLIVATPMAIGNQPRDMTLGLANTGTMCLLATRGAVQVQQQLSGETLVVPQPSELFLQGTSLSAMPAAVGGCQCDFDEPSAQKAVPPAVAVSQGQPLREAPQSKPTQPARSATETPKQAMAPSTNQPIARIDLPPIGYDAKSATVPAEPLSVATLILAKEADVQQDWIFHGVVAQPSRPTRQARTVAVQSPKTKSKEQKKGFWARLHDFFVRSRKRTDCVGEGCS